MGDISSIVRTRRSSCVPQCSAFIALLVFRSESRCSDTSKNADLLPRVSFCCHQGVSPADHRLSSGHPGRAGSHQRPQPTGGLQRAHPASARYGMNRRGGFLRRHTQKVMCCFLLQLVRLVFTLVCFYSGPRA